MEKYFRFDVRQFLKDSKGWDKKLYDLALKLESITELSGPSGNGLPSGGDVSQPTERIALQREDVMKEIRRVENYRNYFNFAWSQLEEEEQDVLTIFYGCDQWDKRELIARWCERHASNRQYCYDRRKDAEKHFAKIIETLL